ncbi:radiation sensitive protein rad9 [Cytospora paraplurivora]|uniref:Radiation sensitive protein rad9 n=1 Tax=Cytospora paraplurivora TaxID=2898453 RepID=A0AAN9YD56_9PEZI
MGPKAPQGLTLAQAANRALRGDVESQDSQLFLEQYHQKYAPGLRSSSPSQPLPPEAVHVQLQQYPRPAKVHQRFAGETGFPPVPKSDARAKAKAKAKADSLGRSARDRPADDKGYTAGTAKRSGVPRATPASVASTSYNQRASPPQSSRHPSGQKTSPFEIATIATESEAVDEDYVRNECLIAHAVTVNPSHLNLAATDDDDGGSHRDPRPPTQASVRPITRRKKLKSGLHNMEISQSPTQSNDGRSYEQYLPRGDDLISADSPEELEPVPQPYEPTSDPPDETRSLHDDDTGAVNFDNIDRYDIDRTAPDLLGMGEPTHGFSGGFSGYPETPAQHKNPFAGSKAHLLGSSQMFQVSSARRAFSPTSSRPSPDNIPVQDPSSPNNIISSPLKNFAGPLPLPDVTSSPQFLPPYDTSPTRQALQEQVASDDDARNTGLFQPKCRPPTALVETYEPVYRAHERNDRSQQSSFDVDSDEASYDHEERRYHRAMLKRMAAEKQLRSISYERQSISRDVVVPSTNTRQEKLQRTASQIYRDQCVERAGGGSQDAVEDSQAAIALHAVEDIDTQSEVIDDSQAGILLLSQEHVKDVSSNVGVVLDTLPNTEDSPTVSPLAEYASSASKPLHESNRPRQGCVDAIPDTSPTRLRPLGDMLPHSSDEASKSESFLNLLDSSFKGSSLDRSGGCSDPLPSIIRSRSPSKAAKLLSHSQRQIAHPPYDMEAQNVPEDVLPTGPEHTTTVDGTRTVLDVSSSPPSLVADTKSMPPGKRENEQSMSPEGPSSSVSTLSVLTTTPTFTSKTTPLTQESPTHISNLTSSSSNEPQTSPAVAKAKRRGSSGTAPKTKPLVTPQKSHRSSIRRLRGSFPRPASVSMGDLARSPSSEPRAFEQSANLSRLSRTSLRQTSGSREISRGSGANLFQGMAFAISFQQRQPGEKDSQYNSRMGLSIKLADKIKRAGGRVLASGFDELFEVSAIKTAEVASSTPPQDEEIKLTSAARNTGFTALIADGHSRKVKYMQALALGLPCIHERWITTCVEKQKLIDWSDYLLCAGNSSFLGNAIRSRTLPSYDVESAKLCTILENRPRLLQGSRILLVLRKQDESMKMAYVFLARVLGASLSRVYSLDEAKRQLKASEDTGYPYDWVYVEKKLAAKADLLEGSVHTVSSSTTLADSSKKRKRKSEVGSAGPPPKKIRALSDELVIQSLILGRLIEEGEISC